MAPLNYVIWGAGAHAAVVAELLHDNGLRVEMFVDDAQHGRLFEGVPIVSQAQARDSISNGSVFPMHVGVGQNSARLRIAKELLGAGGMLATIVARSAVVFRSAAIGAGSLICPGAVVGKSAVLGIVCVINTAASVDHDCEIGDGVHLSPGVHLGGRVTIGDRSWLGVGCSVRDGVRIGRDTIVGVGAAVVSDLPDGVVAYGVPARIQRANS